MNNLEENLKTVNLLVNIALLVEPDQSTEELIVEIPEIQVLDAASGFPLKCVKAKSLEYETIDVKV